MPIHKQIVIRTELPHFPDSANYARECNSGASSFCPVCLSVRLSVCETETKNFNLGHNFWTVRDRVFIIGM